jgi:hypothetical protein
MELAPYFPFANSKLQQVVKASLGHFPQPFLIRDVLRTAAKIYVRLPYFQIPDWIFLKLVYSTNRLLVEFSTFYLLYCIDLQQKVKFLERSYGLVNG